MCDKDYVNKNMENSSFKNKLSFDDCKLLFRWRLNHPQHETRACKEDDEIRTLIVQLITSWTNFEYENPLSKCMIKPRIGKSNGCKWIFTQGPLTGGQCGCLSLQEEIESLEGKLGDKTISKVSRMEKEAILNVKREILQEFEERSQSELRCNHHAGIIFTDKIRKVIEMQSLFDTGN